MEFYQPANFFKHNHCFKLCCEYKLANPYFSVGFPRKFFIKFNGTDPRPHFLPESVVSACLHRLEVVSRKNLWRLIPSVTRWPLPWGCRRQRRRCCRWFWRRCCCWCCRVWKVFTVTTTLTNLSFWWLCSGIHNQRFTNASLVRL